MLRVARPRIDERCEQLPRRVARARRLLGAIVEVLICTRPLRFQNKNFASSVRMKLKG
jgi:hypothetical protein